MYFYFYFLTFFIAMFFFADDSIIYSGGSLYCFAKPQTQSYVQLSFYLGPVSCAQIIGPGAS